MGADNTFGENIFNPDKMTQKDQQQDAITTILSHCKTNMRIHRDRWLDEELPELERGKSLGKYFAYKDIADGIRNGYFETKTDENLK